jgi:transposase-like protein
MHLSREGTIFVYYQFFRQPRNRYRSKNVIYTDADRWYNDDACKWLRLKHHVYYTGLKNLMARFVQQIKDRTECFDDNFSCRNDDCDRQHVWNW